MSLNKYNQLILNKNKDYINIKDSLSKLNGTQTYLYNYCMKFINKILQKEISLFQ